MSDPYLYGKFKAMRDQMPNISGLSFDKDLLNVFVSFKIKIGSDTEPDELKPKLSALDSTGGLSNSVLNYAGRRQEIE